MLTVWSKRERPKMAMYRVWFWAIVSDCDGVSYEKIQETIIPECDMEQLNALDVERVELIN